MEESPSSLHRHLIFPFHYAPGEKSVFVVASIPDAPGSLAALLEVLSKRVNFVGTSSYSAGDSIAIFSGFGRVLSEKMTASHLQAEVLKSASVKDFRAWESNDGLIVDRYHTGFQAGVGEPYVVFPGKGLSDTFEGIVRTFGSGGEVVLYNLGRDYAKARSGLYKKMMGPHPESRLEELAAIVTALGYGLSSGAFDPNYEALRLISRECFECSSPSTCGRKCAFLRGLADGIYGPLFDVEVVSEEIKCRNVGDDHCEFVLKARDGRPLVR